jgi:hypothetical protein
MPINTLGKICASVAVLVGIIAIVLPLSIIQSSFVNERKKTKSRLYDIKQAERIRSMVEANHLDGENSPLLSPKAHANALLKGAPSLHGRNGDNPEGDPKEERSVVVSPSIFDADDTMLLPTLISLVEQLSSTSKIIPDIKTKSEAMLALLSEMKRHPVRPGAGNSLRGIGTEAIGSSAKVHPLGQEGVSHEGTPAGMSPREYLVPIEELRQLYSGIREVFLEGCRMNSSWNAADVAVYTGAAIPEGYRDTQDFAKARPRHSKSAKAQPRVVDEMPPPFQLPTGEGIANSPDDPASPGSTQSSNTSPQRRGL